MARANSSGSSGFITAWQFSSMRLITKGVAKTCTPLLPRACAVSSGVRTCSNSAVRPGVRGMAAPFYPTRAPASIARPEEETEAEEDEQAFEDAGKGLLAHAVDEAPAEPGPADHHYADVEAARDERARQELVASEDDGTGDIGAHRAEGVRRHVGSLAELVAQEERRHDGADEARVARQEAE